MKKLFALVVLVLIAAMLAMPVFAAQSATVSLAVSKNKLSAGDTFTVTVSTTKVENCTSGGFLFQYDENAFEYVDGKALLGGFAMSGISTAGGNLAGYFMATSGSHTVQGDIFSITLKVKASASGSYSISGTPSMLVASGGNKENVSFSTGSVTISVGSSQTDPTAPTSEPTQPQETVAPTTAATEPASEATTEAPTTEASEVPTTAGTEAPTEKVEDPSQETGIITIGPSDSAEDQGAGFPWWILFAVMGIGAIVAIVIIKKKS